MRDWICCLCFTVLLAVAGCETQRASEHGTQLADYNTITVDGVTYAYEVRGDQAVIVKIKGYPREVRIPAEINGAPVVKIKRGAYSVPGAMSYKDPVHSAIAKRVDDSQREEVGYSYHPMAWWDDSYVRKCAYLAPPDTPEAVEGHAFYFGFALHSITLPDTFTTIGKGAFSRCIWLSSVTFPATLVSIGEGAFLHCGLSSVVLPDSLTSIGAYAFAHCNSLTSITIPENVVSIGEGAFCHCHSLGEIHVSEKNPMYYMEDGVLYSRKGEALWYSQATRNIVLRDDTTSILPYAFQSKYHVERSKGSLASITIPQGVTNIAENAFLGCARTVKVTVAPENNHFKFIGGKLVDRKGNILLETWDAYP